MKSGIIPIPINRFTNNKRKIQMGIYAKSNLYAQAIAEFRHKYAIQWQAIAHHFAFKIH